MTKRHSSVRAYGILIHDDRLALVRSSNPKHDPPLWWLPGGGLDFGESPEEALVREFMEETGLRVEQPRLFRVTSDLRSRENGDQVHTVRLIYSVSYHSGELESEIHGTTDHAAWFRYDELDEINVADYARDILDVWFQK